MIIPISIWSDIACPWCFVGKAHLETALAQLADELPDVQLKVRWRAFELDPTPRKPSTQSYVERLAAKYQRSVAQAQEMIDTMTQAISDSGGHADFSKVIAVNTFDAHRLIQWAGDTDGRGETQDAQHRLTDALMRGYLGEGLNLGQNDDLLNVIESLDLSRGDAADVLSSNRYESVVRDDEASAEHYKIRGVPFFAIGGYGLSGAQPSDALVETVRRAQADQAT